MVIKFFHNAKCSKSCEALSLLRSRIGDDEVEVVDYLLSPPSPREILQLCERIGCEVTQIIRAKEPLFEELGLSLDDTRSAGDWSEILAKHPNLLERPIAVRGDRAEIGRPPVNVLRLVEAKS